MRKLAAITCALVAAASMARPAAAFVDDKTGLVVEPTSPFQATAGAPRADADIVVDITSSSGRPTAPNPDGSLCRVTFKLSPRNAGLSQAEINELSVSADRISMVQAQFRVVGALEGTDTFEQEGLKGIEVVVAPKAGPNHESVRLYVALWETPKGRAIVSCAGKVEELAEALTAFRSIRRSVRAPR
ncbi:MAG TPA: hypothetical protein VJ890_10050 [Vineibacter sp.]|nr:hypothetical protein [Vineibacter sp.]